MIFSPIFWVIELRNQENDILLTKSLLITTCCCEPGNCSCAGHDACNTQLSECFDLDQKSMFPVAHELSIITQLKKVMLPEKAESKNLNTRSKLLTRYINKSKKIEVITQIFHPPRKEPYILI